MSQTHKRGSRRRPLDLSGPWVDSNVYNGHVIVRNARGDAVCAVRIPARSFDDRYTAEEEEAARVIARHICAAHATHERIAR